MPRKEPTLQSSLPVHKQHAADPVKAASIDEMAVYNIYHYFIGFSMTSVTYTLALMDALLPQKKYDGLQDTPINRFAVQPAHAAA